MRLILIASAVAASVTGTASAASTPRQDAMIRDYFAVWDSDAGVTIDNLRRFYGPRIVYYGHPMTREDLLADKRAFVRRWPIRRYDVEPGSATKTCDATEERCVLTANLHWRTEGAAGMRSGRSRVSLTLARSDGALKIVREGAVTLGRN